MNNNDKKKEFLLGVKIHSFFGCFSIFDFGHNMILEK